MQTLYGTECLSVRLFHPSPAAAYTLPMARFLKMHGCGNDFVVFDERAGPLGLTARRAAAIADRRTGVGCDQFIAIEPPPEDSNADAFMRIRNPDGAEAGACGNATRCVVDLLARETGRRNQVIRTIAGNLPSRGTRRRSGARRYGAGAARLARHSAGAADGHAAPRPRGGAGGRSGGGQHGQPARDVLRGRPRAPAGGGARPATGARSRCSPSSANIGFAQVLAPDRIRLRVWERGAGLTRACGSGACAALVNAHRRGLTGRRAAVVVDGGELEIEWRAGRPRADDGAGGDVLHRRDRPGGISGMSVEILTFGCRLNAYESEVMRGHAAGAVRHGDRQHLRGDGRGGAPGAPGDPPRGARAARRAHRGHRLRGADRSGGVGDGCPASIACWATRTS